MKQFLLFQNVPQDSKCHMAIGLAAAIGTIGGVYVLTQTTKFIGQIVERRQRRELTDICNICFTELDLSDYKRTSKCFVCEQFICRAKKCSRWVPKEASWECELCSISKESRAKTNEWLEKQVLTNITNNHHPTRIAKSEIYIPVLGDPNNKETGSSPGFISFETCSFAHSSTVPIEEKIRVRDYIESSLASIIDGGSFDDVLVSKMSNNPNYLKLFHKFHSELTQQIRELETYLYAFYRDLPLPESDGELTGISHAKLKQLIEAITKELKLTFKSKDDRPITPTGEQMTQTEIETNNNTQYFHSKKYQELLATAVLNKIADPNLADSSLTETEKLVRSSFRNSIRKSNGKISPSEDNSVTDNLLTARSFTPDDINSDLFTEPIYENLTGRESVIGYLKKHQIPLPDLENDEYPESTEEDEVEEEFDSLNSDNWLLKKKKFGHDAPSVGMLVPAPKEDIRALIGDKTADEISDLSDNEVSEDDFSNDEVVFSNHRIQSDSLISGKHTAGLIDDLIDGSSLVSISSLKENEPELVDTKNRIILNEAVHSLAEGEKPVIDLESGKMPETPQAINTDIILPPPGFADDSSISSPGSIAEREYMKWRNAVDMPNNPYAPDALKKRLSGSNENFMDLPNISPEEKQGSVSLDDASKLEANENGKEYERYSRDYYINLSKCASGRRSTSPANKDEIMDAINNNEVFTARPVEVKEYTEDETYNVKSPLSPASLSFTHDSLTPSEDSDTMRIYDLKKQETSFIPQRPVSLLLVSSEKLSGPTSPTRSYESLSPSKANINFKSIQPKRKLINPSDILFACDQEDSNLNSTNPESSRLIIEQDLVKAMPSVKALAQVFLAKPEKKAEKPMEPKKIFEECNENVQILEGSIKPEEPPKLVNKTPESQVEDNNIQTPGKLKDSIAFFESLRNQ